MDIIVWELILVAVVGLGLGFWQLIDVNRELKKDAEQESGAIDSCHTDSVKENSDRADLGTAAQAPEQVAEVRPKRDA